MTCCLRLRAAVTTASVATAASSTAVAAVAAALDQASHIGFLHAAPAASASISSSGHARFAGRCAGSIRRVQSRGAERAARVLKGGASPLCMTGSF